jgi:predicted DNA-binding antitoxin AbrB/MazE fold protein
MQIIPATYQNGVFAPEGSIQLKEGTRVTLKVVVAESTAATTTGDRASPLPDEPLESQEQGAPFDLPMPPGGTKVKAREGMPLWPDPPLVIE